jgi:hypothetical protein
MNNPNQQYYQYGKEMLKTVHYKVLNNTATPLHYYAIFCLTKGGIFQRGVEYCPPITWSVYTIHMKAVFAFNYNSKHTSGTLHDK